MRNLRIPVMLLLFSVAAMLEATRLSSLSAISNSDIWWHLSTGLWILNQRAYPHTGIFSQSAALPWTALSWGYDVLIALLYKLVELRSIPILLMFFKVALAVATFLLAGGLRGSFWSAVGLSAVAQYILGGVQPEPVYFSILCFAGELLLLIEIRTRGSARLLYLLSALFLVWVNVDARFVYGLAFLIVYLAATGFENLSRSAGSAPKRNFVSMGSVVMAVLLSGIATLCTPYFWRPYAAFFSGVSGASNNYFPDFHAMTFHRPQDYALLLLTMAAFLALGMRRSRDLFLIAVLAGCAMLSFHAQRDTWMVTMASLLVIGEMTGRPPEEIRMPAKWEAWTTAGSVVVVVIVAGLVIPRSRPVLLAKIGESYPVQAGSYIREHGLPQPLFNSYEWGGFLDWYLPEYPVAIDGRPDLYGDDFVIQYSKMMNADLPYSALPAMHDARTVLLPTKSLMGEALSNVPAFKVAYSDSVAVVLTRQD